MFDTRSGFWLMASIGITRVLATGAVILFAPDDELDYESFAAAIGFPMAVILPIIAILLGDQRVEPAQRSDDVHAGAAPRPGHHGEARGHRRHRRRLDRDRPRRSAPSATCSAPRSPGPTRSGTSRSPSSLHRPGQRARAAGRLHARRADPQLGRRDRRLLRLLLRAAAADLPAGRQPAVVPRPAAVGRLQLRPGRPVRRRPDRHHGPTRGRRLVWLVLPLAVGLRLVLRSEVK